MIELAAVFAAGAVCAVAFPPVNAAAVKARDWLYSKFRKAPPIKAGGTD